MKAKRSTFSLMDCIVLIVALALGMGLTSTMPRCGRESEVCQCM